MQKLIEDITRLVHNDVYSDEEKVKIVKGLIKEHYLPTTQQKEDDRIDKAIVDAFNAAREELKEVSIEWRLAGKPYRKYESAEQYLLTLKQQP